MGTVPARLHLDEMDLMQNVFVQQKWRDEWFGSLCAI